MCDCHLEPLVLSKKISNFHIVACSSLIDPFSRLSVLPENMIRDKDEAFILFIYVRCIYTPCIYAPSLIQDQSCMPTFDIALWKLHCIRTYTTEVHSICTYTFNSLLYSSTPLSPLQAGL